MKGRHKKDNILKISELGIVEMTRKRSRETSPRRWPIRVPYCDGHGFLKSKRTVCYEIFRELAKGAGGSREKATVHVNPDVASLLFDEERVWLDEIENDRASGWPFAPCLTFISRSYEIGWG